MNAHFLVSPSHQTLLCLHSMYLPALFQKCLYLPEMCRNRWEIYTVIMVQHILQALILTHKYHLQLNLVHQWIHQHLLHLLLVDILSESDVLQRSGGSLHVTNTGILLLQFRQATMSRSTTSKLSQRMIHCMQVWNRAYIRNHTPILKFRMHSSAYIRNPTPILRFRMRSSLPSKLVFILMIQEHWPRQWHVLMVINGTKQLAMRSKPSWTMVHGNWQRCLQGERLLAAVGFLSSSVIRMVRLIAIKAES